MSGDESIVDRIEEALLHFIDPDSESEPEEVTSLVREALSKVSPAVWERRWVELSNRMGHLSQQESIAGMLGSAVLAEMADVESMIKEDTCPS